MTLLHWAIISPFLFAILIPFLYKAFRNVHTGWFVRIIAASFIYIFLSIHLYNESMGIPLRKPWSGCRPSVSILSLM